MLRMPFHYSFTVERWYRDYSSVLIAQCMGMTRGVQVALSVELNQAHRWFVAKCVRRTPAKLLLLGSYHLAHTVSRLFARVRNTI